jgi:carotenoid cleavage dioxygenase-like enzyme
MPLSVRRANPCLAYWATHIAVELEPDSLTTVGNFDYDGQIDGPITAHPKFDHASGEMVFFGNQAKGPFSEFLRFNVADKKGRLEMVFFGNQAKGPFSEFLRLNVADKTGRLIKNEMIEAPFASFVHDFFVTWYSRFIPWPLTSIGPYRGASPWPGNLIAVLILG